MLNEKIDKMYEKEPKNFKIKVVIFLIVVSIIIFSLAYINDPNVSSGGLGIASDIISGILSPTFKLFNLSSTGIPFLLLETMCIAFLGTLIGAVFAIPIAFISSSNIVPKKLTWIGRILTMIIRTIPSFVYGLMFIRVTGPGAFAGVLTMSLISVGMLTKLFIEIIEDLDFGILESMTSMGFTTFQKITHGIIPQLVSDFISTILYRFDMNLRDATTLGLVGAGGIGASLIFAMNEFRWNDVGAYLLGLIILVFLIEFLSQKIRIKLVRG